MNREQTLKTASLALLLLLLCAQEASAQRVRRLRLARGAGEAAGVLRPGTREARHEYVFNTKAGQRLWVRVTSGRVSMGEAGAVGAVFHVTDAERNTPSEFGDYPYGGPKEWAGVLRAGVYKIVVFVEDTPDDPDEATRRRMNLSLRYRLKVTLR
jgi:hypothetical protein